MAAHRSLAVLTCVLLGVPALSAMAAGPSPSGAPQPTQGATATDAVRGCQAPGCLDLPYGVGYEQRLRIITADADASQTPGNTDVGQQGNTTSHAGASGRNGNGNGNGSGGNGGRRGR